MMVEVLKKAVDKVIFEVESFASENSLHDNAHIRDTLKVLRLLKEDILENKLAIRERVLRAFKDVCTATSIHWEETNFSDPLFDVYNLLKENIPTFGNLELLRNDFGKGDPI